MRIQAVGETEARCEVGMVGDDILGFKAESAGDGQVRAGFPVVLEEEGGIGYRDGDAGTADGDAELRGFASVSQNLRGGKAGGDALLGDLVGVAGGDGGAGGRQRERGEGVGAVVVGGGLVGVAGEAEADAGGIELLAAGGGDVVLQLEAVLVVVVGRAGVAAAEKSSGDVDRGSGGVGMLTDAAARVLEARVLDDFGREDDGVGDLQ